jgi:hypothetical protein
MFGNLNTSGVPCLANYDKANAFFQRTKPWRGSSDDVRPVHPSRRRHMEMRRLPDGSIAFKLYDTDVVTWHPDNTLTIVPYPSRTTNMFAHALLPRGIYPQFDHALGACIETGSHLYSTPSSVRMHEVIEGAWRIVNGGAQFEIPQLDKHAARAALKASRYNDFVTWRKAVIALHGQPEIDYFWPGAAMALAMLQDQAQWPALHKKVYSTRLDNLRCLIYRAHKCFDIERIYALPLHRVGSAVRARHQYGSYAL